MRPKTPGMLVQQCGVGQIAVRIGADGALAFCAPAIQLKPMENEILPLLRAALGGAPLAAGHLPMTAHMGICRLVVRLSTAHDCLAVISDAVALAQLMQCTASNGLAIYGAHQADAPADHEVRAFLMENGMLLEDPVTGSANACIAHLQPSRDHCVRQGTAIGRDGRVTIVYENDKPWIDGQSVTIIDGTFAC